MSVEHPRKLLKRYNLDPKKGLGQNFLCDEGALRRIVAAADLQPEETVIEVGPGLGGLTRLLAQATGQVVAVELDQRFLPVLQVELGGLPNITLVQGDILKSIPRDLAQGRPYKVVANLPYYITGAVIRHLVEASPRPRLMVLTVQLEVAKRMTAQPGKMSVLAVSVQYYGQVRLVSRLSAGVFYPRPGVDSAVVRIDLAAGPRHPAVDEQLLFRVVRAGFGQKRKQLKNSLRAGLGWLVREEIEAALVGAGIDPQRRAETLSVAEWVALSDKLKPERSSAADLHAG